MPSAAEAMAAYGIKRPDVTIRAAAAAGLELAVACTMLMAESGGGRMVWGHDPVDAAGIYIKGGPVTQDNYLAYRAAMAAGRIGRQGVGDCQLTSSEFQDRGDQLGGCWDPYANQRAGFLGLADRINRWGLRDGLRRYNGSGPAAEAYADARMREVAIWRQRLAGLAPTPQDVHREEDDMQDWLITGKGRRVIGCPTGSNSAWHRQAWLSAMAAVVAGPAWIQVFAQGDNAGIHDWRWTEQDLAPVPPPDNRVHRARREVRDGTSHLVVSWDLSQCPEGATLMLETNITALGASA